LTEKKGKERGDNDSRKWKASLIRGKSSKNENGPRQSKLSIHNDHKSQRGPYA
jgi:hypothetical protein